MFGAPGRIANVAPAAGGGASIYTVTEGTVNQSGTDFFGFSDGTNGYLNTGIGSISPLQFDGNNIVTVSFDAFLQDNFAFAITGNFTAAPEALFEAVQPEGSAILRADGRFTVGYNSLRNYTLWEWRDNVKQPVSIPANWDGVGSSGFTVYPIGFFADPETKTFTITQGTWTSGFERGYGYLEAGSRSPVSFYDGTVLLEASWANFGATYPVTIKVAGAKKETWLTSVTPQGGGTYTPLAGSWSVSSQVTSWQCETNNAGLGTTWDGTGDVTIDITIDPSVV